jgi:general secretion pathway protein F
MPIYSYRGMNRTGKEIKSSITTESMVQAKAKLKGMGIMLIEIREQTSKKAGGGSEETVLSKLTRKKININELSLMTRQLATLIKARIQIVEALAALVDQVDSPQLKVILSEVKGKVNEGSSLAKALGEHPNVFNNVYVNMVDAGEASGTLDIVLLRLAEFTEAQVKLKNKIQGAMVYPVIMMVFGFLMMNAIFIFVIPKIAKIFTAMKKELPLQTKLCIAFSEFMQSYWWSLPLVAFAAWYIFDKWKNTTQGERQWHGIILSLPLIGPISRMINVSRFCSTLATLLNSGVPILTAMNIVRNLISNVLMKEAIEKSRDSVSEGASMTGPLIESGQFPTLVTHMIRLGERSGELEPMLNIVADNYQDQVETKITGLTSTLEPIMMIGLGAAVGFIVFSVIVPMMEINTVR